MGIRESRTWYYLKRPPLRTLLLLLAVLLFIFFCYLVWSPGKRVYDGRYDLRSNGIWLQHGWLGDDKWFSVNRRDKSKFRDSKKIEELAGLLKKHGIKYAYPHLCPSSPRGDLPQVDNEQTEKFLDAMDGVDVLPWIGGVYEGCCYPDSEKWRKRFVASIVELLQAHPRLAGIHVNIEPMADGNKGYIILLKKIKSSIPAGKIVSVAAYPPPTRWHQYSDVHWGKSYYFEISNEVDQLAVMMYDTSIRVPKIYQKLMSDWTREIIPWCGNTKVLLGVPSYDDAGVGYHFSSVENLENSIKGINAGLGRFKELPKNYSGIAVYCEWETDEAEWKFLKNEFEKK
ncbi:MAG: glycoside hydrolase family 18 protein [Victivallales bacterium]